MKNYLLVIITIFALSISEAQTKFPIEKMEEVANAYFKAYSEMDFEKMATLYHNNIQFEDNTYMDNSGKGAYLKGKETIKNTFQNIYFPKAKKAKFNEEERFFSGTQGIFRGKGTSYIKGSAAGKSDKETILYTSPYVMVLTFEMEGEQLKIVHHTDHVNYKKTSYKWEDSK